MKRTTERAAEEGQLSLATYKKGASCLGLTDSWEIIGNDLMDS